MRLSIEVTPEQHQRLKAIAALSGKSIKDYVLERVFLESSSPANGEEALRELEAFLEPRIKGAQDAVSGKSVKQIFEETRQETR